MLMPISCLILIYRYKKVLKEPIGKGGMGKVRDVMTVLLLLPCDHYRCHLIPRCQVFKCSALEDGHICAIKKIKLDRRDTAAGACARGHGCDIKCYSFTLRQWTPCLMKSISFAASKAIPTCATTMLLQQGVLCGMFA
jgi:hypothetical protein